MDTRIAYIWVPLLAATLDLFAAPQYIPIKERVRESRVVVVARITRPRKVATRISAHRLKIRLPIEVKETLKGKAPRKFELPVIIEPRGYGNHLRAPPGPGIYILFLLQRGGKTQQSRPRKPKLVPYNPQTFFFLKYNARNMRDVTLHVLK